MFEETSPENKNGSRWKKILLSIAVSPINSLFGAVILFYAARIFIFGQDTLLIKLEAGGVVYGHLPKALSRFCCLSPCWPPALLSIINIPTAMKSSVKTTEAVGTANGKPAKKKAAFGSRSDAGSRISPAVFQAGAF